MTYALPFPVAPQCCEQHRTPPKSVFAMVGGYLTAFMATLSLTMEKAHQRAELAELSDHLLRDIGMTQRQALDEAARRFWP
jgi:uncharacterized protein YjiS (DUF1127 family)